MTLGPSRILYSFFALCHFPFALHHHFLQLPVVLFLFRVPLVWIAIFFWRAVRVMMWYLLLVYIVISLIISSIIVFDEFYGCGFINFGHYIFYLPLVFTLHLWNGLVKWLPNLPYSTHSALVRRKPLERLSSVFCLIWIYVTGLPVRFFEHDWFLNALESTNCISVIATPSIVK